MIRLFLRDVINGHKTPENLRAHSSNEVIDYETQYGEWKIQLTMLIILFLLNILMRPVTCIKRVTT